MNWYTSKNDPTITWGKDDIIDLLEQYDPAWEDHWYVKGETIYLWGRRDRVAIYVYNCEASVFFGNPAVPVWFDDPIVAIITAMNHRWEDDISRRPYSVRFHFQGANAAHDTAGVLPGSSSVPQAGQEVLGLGHANHSPDPVTSVAVHLDPQLLHQGEAVVKRLFNREIFWGDGAYSGLLGHELHKRLDAAMGCTGCLQQAGCGPDPIGDEHIRLIEQELETAVRDIVAATMNCEVTFGPRKEWNDPAENMPGWETIIVDLVNNTITHRHVQSLGMGRGRQFVVSIPSALVGDKEIAQKLLAPKPKGFCPDAHPKSLEWVKHIKVCADNSLCIQCGIQDYDETCGEYMFPYCRMHDPYGQYYPQWNDELKEEKK